MHGSWLATVHAAYPFKLLIINNKICSVDSHFINDPAVSGLKLYVRTPEAIQMLKIMLATIFLARISFLIALRS